MPCFEKYNKVIEIISYGKIPGPSRKDLAAHKKLTEDVKNLYSGVEYYRIFDLNKKK